MSEKSDMSHTVSQSRTLEKQKHAEELSQGRISHKRYEDVIERGYNIINVIPFKGIGGGLLLFLVNTPTIGMNGKICFQRLQQCQRRHPETRFVQYFLVLTFNDLNLDIRR
jgi:hypothetical protein